MEGNMSKERNTGVLRLIKTYPPTPRHFDPGKATQEELEYYGIPHRPDPEKEPELSRMWKRIFTRRIKFIKAKVKYRKPLNGTSSEDRNRWAGVVKLLDQHEPDYIEPANMIYGQLQLPFVPAVSLDETIAMAFWVGLDGHPSLQSPASKQLLQAGVAAQVNPPGFFPWQTANVKWWAWTEWIDDINKDNACEVKNFPVGPGDEIFVTIYSPQLNFGFISMTNISRGLGVSIGVNAPPGVEVHGLSAEWIVEVPPSSPHIPVFSQVTFYNCNAGTQQGIFNLSGGNVTNINSNGSTTSPWGHPITQTFIASPTIAVIRELELDWF
jgi:Peptidase A4 family